jgi:hypothetical protein
MMRFSRAAQAAVLGTAGLALAGALIFPAVATTERGPLIINDVSDAFALEGNTTKAFGASGVVGQNAGSTDGNGVLGRNMAAHGIGVEGISTNLTAGTGVYGTARVGAGVFGLSNSSYPGVMGNSSTAKGTGVAALSPGDGIYSLSTGENGVVGVTRAGTAPAGKEFAGVLGETQSGTNYGIAGTATGLGTAIGAFAENGIGVFVQATRGIGVEALGPSQPGKEEAVLAGSPLSHLYYDYGVPFGVFGQEFVGDGVFGIGGNGVKGLAVDDGIGVDGIGGVGAEGTGNVALAGFSTANSSVGAAPNPVPTAPTALYLASDDFYTGGTGDEIEAYCTFRLPPKVNAANNCPGGAASVEVMNLDQSGNMNLAGKITAASVTQSTASVSTNVRRVSYAATAASPTLEDNGEATLANGIASVHLDPAFADSIDRTAPYLISITPLGDTQGLYVSERSPGGFVVREHAGGHSSVVFDYRIVARPAGNRAPRLPVITATQPRHVRASTKNPVSGDDMAPAHRAAPDAGPLPLGFSSGR